jgi:hypothetical protein
MFMRYFSIHYEKLFFIHKNNLFDAFTRSGTIALSVVKEKQLFKEEIKRLSG